MGIYLNNTHLHQRPYSKRYAAGAARKSVIACRVTEQSKSYVEALANELNISISEYLARLVSDHIAQDQLKRKPKMKSLEGYQ